MSKFTELKQAPDDSWTIEVPRESGLVEVVQLPKLTKEQAIREAMRRGYNDIRCWDKKVLEAITTGKARLDFST